VRKAAAALAAGDDLGGRGDVASARRVAPPRLEAAGLGRDGHPRSEPLLRRADGASPARARATRAGAADEVLPPALAGRRLRRRLQRAARAGPLLEPLRVSARDRARAPPPAGPAPREAGRRVRAPAGRPAAAVRLPRRRPHGVQDPAAGDDDEEAE